jgi:hypothetical protein
MVSPVVNSPENPAAGRVKYGLDVTGLFGAAPEVTLPAAMDPRVSPAIVNAEPLVNVRVQV